MYLNFRTGEIGKIGGIGEIGGNWGLCIVYRWFWRDERNERDERNDHDRDEHNNHGRIVLGYGLKA